MNTEIQLKKFRTFDLKTFLSLRKVEAFNRKVRSVPIGSLNLFLSKNLKDHQTVSQIDTYISEKDGVQFAFFGKFCQIFGTICCFG